jgi:hypothetical protein
MRKKINDVSIWLNGFLIKKEFNKFNIIKLNILIFFVYDFVNFFRYWSNDLIK